MNKVKYPNVSIGGFASRGSRQMDMQACPLGSLLRENKNNGRYQTTGLTLLILLVVLFIFKYAIYMNKSGNFPTIKQSITKIVRKSKEIFFFVQYYIL